MMSDYKVNLVNDSVSEFHVIFSGPKDSKWNTPPARTSLA